MLRITAVIHAFSSLQPDGTPRPIPARDPRQRRTASSIAPGPSWPAPTRMRLRINQRCLERPAGSLGVVLDQVIERFPALHSLRNGSNGEPSARYHRLPPPDLGIRFDEALSPFPVAAQPLEGVTERWIEPNHDHVTELKLWLLRRCVRLRLLEPATRNPRLAGQQEGEVFRAGRSQSSSLTTATIFVLSFGAQPSNLAFA